MTPALFFYSFFYFMLFAFRKLKRAQPSTLVIHPIYSLEEACEGIRRERRVSNTKKGLGSWMSHIKFANVVIFQHVLCLTRVVHLEVPHRRVLTCGDQNNGVGSAKQVQTKERRFFFSRLITGQFFNHLATSWMLQAEPFTDVKDIHTQRGTCKRVSQSINPLPTKK